MVSANQLIASTNNNLLIRVIAMIANEHDAKHQHPWHQLIFARSGMLRTRVAQRDYYLPSQRAIFIPAGCQHESWAIVPTDFVGIYFSPELLIGLADKVTNKVIPNDECQVLAISPFFKALLLEIISFADYQASFNAAQQMLVQVFADQFCQQQRISLDLLLPQDKRLQPIVSQLLIQPSCDLSLQVWSQQVGASSRTLSRLFIKQTGLSFRQWRQKLKLINSLALLEQGVAIQTIALQLGYNSSSAFIYSFKQVFGDSPQTYLGKNAS